MERILKTSINITNMNEVSQRESMEYDIVIIGAGPAGLSTAIKLKQLNSKLSGCFLETFFINVIYLSIASVSFGNFILKNNFHFSTPVGK